MKCCGKNVLLMIVIITLNISIGNINGYADEWQQDYNIKSSNNWSSGSLSLLGGSGYLFGEKKRTIATFDYSSGGKIGSNHFFFDVINPNSNFITIYGEWHPAFNLSNLFNQATPFWGIKYISLAGEYDYGTNPMFSFRSYYYGFGAELNVKSADYLNINFMIGGNPALQGDTKQVSISWAFPFNYFDVHGVFSGFLDYIGSESSLVSHIQSQPQLLFDVGSIMNFKNRIYLGMEYQYWRNKFGIEGFDEKVTQLILKLIL